MKSKPLWLKWLFCAIPTFIAAIMYFVLPLFPKFTEYFITRGIFRIIAFPYEWIMSVFPFSVTEIVVLLLIPAIIILIAFWIFKIIRSENKKKTTEIGLRFAAWCFSLFLLIFMIMDGANFSRLSVSELLELPNKTYTAEDLCKITSHLAEKASKSRENLPEDKNGNAIFTVSQSKILELADDSYNNIKEDYLFLKTAVYRVKPVMLSYYWSFTGYTGVYCPWLGEASVNVDVPDYSVPHTAAHEIAHTMGFAKENECNFLAWLACSTSNLPDYEYSGYLQAYIYCSNALYKADKELFKIAYSNCSKGMINDLINHSEYWDKFEGEVMESSQDFNDSFIKVNGVESGILSYDEMVELLLRYYHKIGFIN